MAIHLIVGMHTLSVKASLADTKSIQNIRYRTFLIIMNGHKNINLYTVYSTALLIYFNMRYFMKFPVNLVISILSDNIVELKWCPIHLFKVKVFSQ